MDKREPINCETVIIYLDGAREALEGARYNLDGDFCGIAVNRAYYAFFYAATALLLTLDLTRSKHSGVLATFRQHFVKTGIFPVRDSHSYGQAFELRNVTDYEMLGKASATQAHTIIEDAKQFVERCECYLSERGYL